MIRKLFFLSFVFLLFLIGCDSKTNTAVSDSRNDSIRKYLELGANIKLSSDLRNKYNHKAFSLIDLSKNDTLIRNYLATLSYNYMNLNNGKSINKVGKIHYKKSISASDTLNLARHYRYKAGYFKRTFVNDSALYYYLKAEKFYKKTNDIQSLGVVLLNKGIVQFNAVDYLGSEVSLLKAYSIFRASKNKERIYSSLNQLGLVYNELAEYDKSLYYHKKALEVVLLNNLRTGYKDAVCYNNIGYLYLNQKKYKKAIINFELGQKNKGIINDDVELYALLKSNLAHCNLSIKNYKEAYENLRDGLIVKEDINGMPVLINIYINFSIYYQKMNNNDLALEYSNLALNLADKSKNKINYLLALKQLSAVNESYLPKYFKLYVKTNEEFQIEERKARNNFARIAYETEEITQEKDKAINQKWIVIGILTFIIFIIALLLIITRQRTRNKELELTQYQQKANEEIYDLMLTQRNKEEEARQQEKKRIALELHDGIMNKLTSTRLNLHVLYHRRDEQTIEECLSHIKEIYNVEQEIRNISHDLSLDIFKNNNSFKDLIADFLNSQNKNYYTHFKLEIDDSLAWENIPSVVKINLLRIIQEACTNINKFAEAGNAIISFILDEGNLCLSITDDGKGFDVKKKGEGIGLKNIELRVNNLQGRFVIQSNNKHTTLNIAIPI